MKVVIIGNGISGVTTALELRKRNTDAEIVILSNETNYFYSRPALMYIYMKEMTLQDTQPYENNFWKNKNIQLINDTVLSVNYSKKELSLKIKKTISYDKLVIAVGSKPNMFGWPGQDLPGVQGFYSMQDLQLLEKNTSKLNKSSRAIVVGGGLIGIELAEMLQSRNIPVTFLVREKSYWPIALSSLEGKIVEQEIENHGIDLRMETEIESIQAANDGRVTSVQIKNGEKLGANLVCFAVGVSPNIEIFKNSDLQIKRGICVNDNLETNILDVYAIGDCVQFCSPDGGRAKMEQVWYTGRMHGEVLGARLAGENKIYHRPKWYNSAKFFTIDYQTYGWLLPKDELKFLFYRVPGKNKSIRIAYNRDGIVKGFNLLGIHYRHSICEKWLEENKNIEYVLEHLKEANFDPEFYPLYNSELANEYQK